MSGPAAGAVGAGRLCATLGIGQAVSADVGGTSFDTCLILNGEPGLKHQGSVAGLPIQAPWIDVRSIGAGGGSIAYVDSGGFMHVGPQSAGARPGPACYGRGGIEPTVSDAAAVLGMLADGKLAGGVNLDFAAARAALQPLADNLRLDVPAVARGILTIATANMADAIREVTIEQGYDPRAGALVCFGGAGPLFGALLAVELGVTTIVIPSQAGNFSARGLLAQHLVQRAARTAVMPLDADGLRQAQRVLHKLFEALLARSNVSPDAVTYEASLDLRYAGQEYTLTIPTALTDRHYSSDVATVRRAFIAEYERVFGHAMNERAEIVSVRAAIRRDLDDVPDLDEDSPSSDPEDGLADAFSFTREDWMPFRLMSRGKLAEGTSINGPAIIREPTATTYVDAGYRLRLDRVGTMVISEEERC